MFVDDYIKSEIKKHSLSDIENECCGLVVFSSKDKVNIVFPCENKAKQRDSRFSICPKDYLKASSLGKIIAMYHSHPKQALDGFSELDKIQSSGHRLPSILYNIERDKFLLFEPEEYQDPYVGRAFRIGTQDCFTLLTDYYKNELNKIWHKLEQEQQNAETEFAKSASYQRAIQSERQAAGIAKLHHVVDFVKNTMEIEESVVVFCHHKVIHTLLHEKLGEFNPASIIGGQTDKARQDSIDNFQEGKTKLMIAGLRAGNVGINLTTAKYVIFAELDWSPAIHRQAEDRLHRIGQKNTVFAYYLIGNGTLDDHVGDILIDKEYEIDAIMDERTESFENKEKSKLILAQIHDKILTKN